MGVELPCLRSLRSTSCFDASASLHSLDALRRFGALAQMVELFKEVASLLLPSWHGAPKLLDNASRFASDAVQFAGHDSISNGEGLGC